jgi:hypothetical protein
MSYLDRDNYTRDQIVEAVQITKDILYDIGDLSYPNISGSIGMNYLYPAGS